MAKRLFSKYVWLVNTIMQHNTGITFPEINNLWKKSAFSDGKDIPLRTFHNHRKAIEEDFDIIIECDKKRGNIYYIDQYDFDNNLKTREWMLNNFAINNLLNESKRLYDRILFEEIPSGREFLADIVEAMRGNNVINITYQGFDKNKPNAVLVNPYCIKVFKLRWYLIAHNKELKCIRTYALDRIKSLNITDKKFKYPESFSPQLYFKDCFGIIADQKIKTENILLKVHTEQCPYFKALPLHESQQILQFDDEFSLFAYRLKPTFDFIQELLSYGDAIEVLEPKSLRDNMNAMIKNMSNAYGKE